MRALRRRLRSLLPLVAALAFVPLAGDAANSIHCCNVATSFATSLFGGGNGDEDFFSVPGGSPNVMILLDNSTSMLDFANPLPFPSSLGSMANQGTCSGTALDDTSALLLSPPSTPPYDNGYSTSLVKDDPPWGLGKCTKGSGTCLFYPSSFYYYGAGNLGDGKGTWTTDSASEYTAASVCAGAKSPAACQTCLNTSGYYLFVDQGTGPSGLLTRGANNAVFRGDFLNVYPPKFVVARKVVKDLARLDDLNPSYLDNVRIGLTILNPSNGNGLPISTSLSTYDGGQLVVPLGPDCTAYPMSNTAMQVPRQALIDSINSSSLVKFYATGSWGSGIGTPLAETLYNLGQYFTTPASVDANNPYSKLFGSSWMNGAFVESVGGTAKASWAGNNKYQHSICWPCQQSSVVVVTDGQPSVDNNLPRSGVSSKHSSITTSSGTGDFRLWSNNLVDCAGCGTDANNGSANLLHKVAAFMWQTDLRTEAGMAGAQGVNTYTISFGLDPGVSENGPALTLLQKTADLGHGTFANTMNGADLEQALNDAATDIIARATSFSVSNTTPLQTSQNTQLFLARFRPSTAPDWEGHLYRFKIFNEFAEGCDATKPTSAQTPAACTTASGGTRLVNPNLNGDEQNGNAVCTSVFILDGDCDPVLEDSTGAFMKASFDATHNLVAGTVDAKPIWDAGQILSTPALAGAASDPDGGNPWRSAEDDPGKPNYPKRRLVYTVVDSDANGQFTPADSRIELTTGNVATLQPYLGLDSTYCTTLYQKMGVFGSSGWDPTDLTQCAKQVIYFIRGWDVLDEDGDGCAGPGYPGNAANCPGGADGEERDRANDSRDPQAFWKLGDIFHSSPSVVNPPAAEFICDLALDNQCVATLHSSPLLTGAVQTPADYDVNGNGTIEPGEDAYEKYRQDHSQRVRLVLVGANDGMLHAFDAGKADTSRPADWLGNYPYSDGSGAELWAFIPPDLLPKLKNALLGHDYYVDGNTMVRDVWVDGSDGTSLNGVKEPTEFHTLAVLSERSGGSEYVALDVTDPRDPRFRWMYPQPCSIDVSMMGQSWTGFAPRPPPIGPVKLAVAKNGPQDPKGRGFEERWVAMVNGGYDPSLTRGRGVWMLDAWTGSTVWRFTNDDFSDRIGANKGGMWPVPGGPALLDVGTSTAAKVDSDGFFDTATWGDIGGQIYVARFSTPGTCAGAPCAAGSMVTNWSAARAFEQQRQTNDSQPVSGRSEFYYMPANTVDPATGFLHTYLGSGNREKMLVVGGSCGPDNVFGCFQAGCNTDVTTDYNYGSCDYNVKAHANNGTIKQDRSSGGCSDTSALTCSGLNIDVKVQTVCNGWKPTGGAFHANLVCDASGNCSSKLHIQRGSSAPASKLTNPKIHNRFYGIWSYGGTSRSLADCSGDGCAWTSAQAFDAGRFTDVPYGAACTGTSGNTCTLLDVTYASVNAAGAVTCGNGAPCSAGGYDPGWVYEYGHAAACPLAGTCDATDWTDEKTGSGATVLAGCVDWNTFRPMGSAISAASPCQTNSGTPRNYTYLADFLSGVPSTTCGITGTNIIARAASRTTIAPPLDPTQMVAIGAGTHLVQFSTAQIEPGIPPQSQTVGSVSETNRMIYWLEVPRTLHSCRHTDATQCE